MTALLIASATWSCDNTSGTLVRGGAAGAKGNAGAGGITTPGAAGAGGEMANGGRAGSSAVGAGGMAGGGGGGAAAGGTAPTGGAAGSAIGGAAGNVGGPSGCGTPGVLYDGKVAVIDVFAHPSGFIIVRADSVSLVGRDRQVVRALPFSREITAAAFDGTRLVVADRAALTVLTADLTMGPSVLVSETCAAGVLVSGGRFVCGPNVDWDRLFYTYDVAAATPALIATSAPETYHGVPMRRVPGTDDFVTVTTNLSPSDFYLHHVDASGKVAYVNESPYHGAFAATTVFAFDGAPAAHLIQIAGLMLKIYADGCNAMTNSFTSGCFVKDGALGNLFDQQFFAGLGDDAAGNVFGLVGSSSFIFDSPCKAPAGCAIQKIDVASRTITSQKTYVIPSLLQVLRLIPDTACGTVAMAYTLPDSASSLQPGGYHVESYAY